MYLQGDWTMAGTKEELERDIGNGFIVRVGWTETVSDSIYCEMISDDRPARYRVVIWNEGGVRGKIAAIVDKPAYVER